MRDRTRERLQDIPDWRRHYIGKYGVELAIALNQAMNEIGTNEEIADVLGCPVEHVHSIRANGAQATNLKEIAKIEQESGVQVISLPIDQDD